MVNCHRAGTPRRSIRISVSVLFVCLRQPKIHSVCYVRPVNHEIGACVRAIIKLPMSQPKPEDRSWGAGRTNYPDDVSTITPLIFAAAIQLSKAAFDHDGIGMYESCVVFPRGHNCPATVAERYMCMIEPRDFGPYQQALWWTHIGHGVLIPGAPIRAESGPWTSP